MSEQAPSSANGVIRDATADDLPAIVEIYNEAVASRESTADTEPVTVEGQRLWFHEHNPATRPLWVLEREGSIAGWLSIHSYHGKPAYHITGEVSVYIHPKHRRHGVARRLLTEAIERGHGMGLKNLLAFVFRDNEASMKLFDRLEFQTWGVLPGVVDMDGSDLDVVILGRRLENPTSSREAGRMGLER